MILQIEKHAHIYKRMEDNNGTWFQLSFHFPATGLKLAIKIIFHLRNCLSSLNASFKQI